MKNFLFYIFMVCLLLLLPIHNVYAGYYCNSSTISNSERKATDYKITYDITEFNVGTDGNIKISGWSALDHMDNYGGTNGNMKIQIIAYVAGGNEKAYDVNWNNNIDMYALRCSGGRCTKQIKNDINRKIKNNQKILEDSSCIWNPSKYYSSPNSYDGGSHCAYHNLGFTANLNVDQIIHDLDITKTTDVKFKIRTQVYYGKKLNKVKRNGIYKVNESNLGIIVNEDNKTVCTIYGRNCVEGTEMSTSRSTSLYGIKYNQKITVKALSKQVYFSTVGAGRYYNNDSNSSNCFFSFNQNYTIQAIGDIKKYSHNAGDVETRRIKIENYWAYMFWVKPSGGITLTLTPAPEDKPPCGYCVGSGCKYESNGCPIKPRDLEPVSCGSVDKNGCSNMTYNESCNASVVSDGYYYRMKVSDFDTKISGYELSSGQNLVIKKDGYYYFPVKFKANVTYNQTGGLTIKDFQDGSEIVSGRSFSYSFQYNIASSWRYRGDYNIDTSVNNTFESVTLSVKKKATNTGDRLTVIVYLGNGDEIYKKSGESFISAGSYNLNFLKSIVSESVKRRAKNNLDGLGNIVTFDDSNDASKKANVTDAGTFNCIESNDSVSANDWEAGKVRNFTCNYKIKKAFFSNTSNGDVLYSDSDSVSNYQVDANNVNGEKSLYYVPINLKTGDNFRFKVKANNLSLIDGFDVKYNASCYVTGKNEIRDTSKLKYRSIDTSNPFPKGSYPKNWKKYVEDNREDRITNNSFSAISYQTNFFKNKSYIDGLKITYGDYYSYNDMDTSGNGTSAIIHKENLFSKINGNHCKAGKYSISCDRIQS